MRGGRAFLHLEDGALDLVACTDAHDRSHIAAPRAVMPGSLTRNGGVGPSSLLGRALTAQRCLTLAHFGPAGKAALRRYYCFASGAARTWRQAAGNCAIVIGGFGFG